MLLDCARDVLTSTRSCQINLCCLFRKRHQSVSSTTTAFCTAQQALLLRWSNGKTRNSLKYRCQPQAQRRSAITCSISATRAGSSSNQASAVDLLWLLVLSSCLVTRYGSCRCARAAFARFKTSEGPEPFLCRLIPQHAAAVFFCLEVPYVALLLVPFYLLFMPGDKSGALQTFMHTFTRSAYFATETWLLTALLLLSPLR